MQVTPPPGYGAIQPFDLSSFGRKGVVARGRYDFARNLQAIYLNAVEFAQAARHLPVVFVVEAGANIPVPMAITGLAEGQNLFVDDEGQWPQAVYVPAYLRRYPFCVVHVRRSPDAAPEPMVCVDPQGLTDAGPALFDERGVPSTHWRRFERLLSDFEAARQATERFVLALRDQGVLEQFEAQAFHRSGRQYGMTHMYRASEKRLSKLPAKMLRHWLDNGYFQLIYAHLLSLDNFQRLLERA